MELITVSSDVRISSRDISSLTNKEHKNVCRDIKTQLGEIPSLKFEQSYIAENGQSYKEYILPKNIALGIVSGYSFDLRMRIINRLEELENKQPNIQLLSRKQLAMMVIEQEERIEELEKTKAYISDKKTATALNTASQAVKHANKLQIELDKSKEYCTIKRMSMLTHGQTYSFKALREASNEMHLPSIDIFDANYGTVKAYHKNVWLEVYGLEF